MGISPHRGVSKIRLETAMAELAADILSLAEIALNAHLSSLTSYGSALRADPLPHALNSNRRRSAVASISHAH